MLVLVWPTAVFADAMTAVPQGPLHFRRDLHADVNLISENFRLIDSDGKLRELASASGKKKIVLLGWESNCPGARDILSWAEHARAGGGKETQLLFLDSSRPQSRSRVNELRLGVTHAPVLMDFTQTITRGFKFGHSGDYIVFDAGSGRILGSGRAYSKELATVLRADAKPSIANRFVGLMRHGLSLIFPPAPACELSFSGEGAQFTRNVATALYRECLSCHQRNKALDIFPTLEKFKGWHAMNRTVLRLFRMPPGGLDYETPLTSPLFLASDLSLVANWIENGEPVSDSERELFQKQLEHVSDGKLERPSLVWSMKTPDRIPAKGTLKYLYRQFGPLSRDYAFRAVSLDQNMSVVHHMAVYLSDRSFPGANLPPGKTWVENGSMGEPRLEARDIPLKNWEKILEWGSSKGFYFAPAGTVFRAPKGSFVIVENHYESSGKEEENRTKLEFFDDPAPEGKRSPRKLELPRVRFTIPPYAKSFEILPESKLEKDTSIMGFMAHGHYRFYRYWAEILYPEGRQRVIGSVVSRNLSLPMSFNFVKPIFAPAGSTIRFHLFYDNSAANPLNPDPSRAVSNGFSFEFDEMDLAQVTIVDGRIVGAVDLRDSTPALLPPP